MTLRGFILVATLLLAGCSPVLAATGGPALKQPVKPAPVKTITLTAAQATAIFAVVNAVNPTFPHPVQGP